MVAVQEFVTFKLWVGVNIDQAWSDPHCTRRSQIRTTPVDRRRTHPSSKPHRGSFKAGDALATPQASKII